MFLRIDDSHARSLSKAVSWRILGSIDTFLISLLFTGSLVAAGSIASVETLTKIILYYLHERAWSKVSLGRKAFAADPRPGVPAADSASSHSLRPTTFPARTLPFVHFFRGAST